jgi:predicted Zn-dependent protease
VEHLARARALAPNRKELRLHYAMGLIRLGRTDEGKAHLQELAASQEDFPGKAEIPIALGRL